MAMAWLRTMSVPEICILGPVMRAMELVASIWATAIGTAAAWHMTILMQQLFILGPAISGMEPDAVAWGSAMGPAAAWERIRIEPGSCSPRAAAWETSGAATC